MSSVKKIFNTKKVAVDGYILGGSEGGQRDGLRVNNRQVVRIDDLPINSQGVALLAYDSSKDLFIAGTLTDIYGQNINVGFQQLGSQTSSGSGTLQQSNIELASVSNTVTITGSGPVSSSGIHAFVYDTLDEMTNVYVASGSSHYVTSSGIYNYIESITTGTVTNGNMFLMSSSGVHNELYNVLALNPVIGTLDDSSSGSSNPITASGVYNYIKSHLAEAHELVHVLNGSSSGRDDPITASGVWNYLQNNTIDLVHVLNGSSSGRDVPITASGVWNYLEAASYIPMSALVNTVSSGAVYPVTSSGVHSYLKSNFLWNSDALEKTSGVSIISSGGSNKYQFGSIAYNDTRKISLTKGTYTILNVPSSHAIYLKGTGSITSATGTGIPGVTITGTSSVNGNSSIGDVVHAFAGTVTITVTQPFEMLSYVCYTHGYMGGEDKLVYSDPPRMVEGTTVLHQLNASGSGSSDPVSASGIWNYLQNNTSNIELVHVLNGSSSGSSSAISASGVYNYIQQLSPVLNANVTNTLSSGSLELVTSSGIYDYLENNIPELRTLEHVLGSSSSGNANPITASGVYNYIQQLSPVLNANVTNTLSSGSLELVTSSGIYDYLENNIPELRTLEHVLGSSSSGNANPITASGVWNYLAAASYIPMSALVNTVSSGAVYPVTSSGIYDFVNNVVGSGINITTENVHENTEMLRLLDVNINTTLTSSGTADVTFFSSGDIIHGAPLYFNKKNLLFESGEAPVISMAQSIDAISGEPILTVRKQDGSEIVLNLTPSSGSGTDISMLNVMTGNEQSTMPMSSSGIYDFVTTRLVDFLPISNVTDSVTNMDSSPISSSGVYNELYNVLQLEKTIHTLSEDEAGSSNPISASGVLEFIALNSVFLVNEITGSGKDDPNPVSASGVYKFVKQEMSSGVVTTDIISSGSSAAITSSGLYDFLQLASFLPIKSVVQTVSSGDSLPVSSSGIYNYLQNNIPELRTLVHVLGSSSSGSGNPVTASGVWNYIQLLSPVLNANVTNTLSSGSLELVTSSGIYDYLQNNIPELRTLVHVLGSSSSGSADPITASGVYHFMAQNAMFVVDTIDDASSGSGDPITASGVYNYIESKTLQTVSSGSSQFVTSSGIYDAITSSVADAVFLVESNFTNSVSSGNTSAITSSGLYDHLQLASFIPGNSVIHTVSSGSPFIVSSSGIYDYLQDNIPELRTLVHVLGSSSSGSGNPVTASGVYNYIESKTLQTVSSGSSQFVTSSGIYDAITSSVLDAVILVESNFTNSVSSGNTSAITSSGLYDHLQLASFIPGNSVIHTVSSGSPFIVSSSGIYNYLQDNIPELRTLEHVLGSSSSGSGNPVTASGVYNYIESKTLQTVMAGSSQFVTSSGIYDAITSSVTDAVILVESNFTNSVSSGSSAAITSSGVYNYIESNTLQTVMAGSSQFVTSSGIYDAIESKRVFMDGLYVQTSGLTASVTGTEVKVNCTDKTYIAKSAEISGSEIHTVELVKVSSGLNFVLAVSRDTGATFAVSSGLKVTENRVSIPTVTNLDTDLNVVADGRVMISGIVMYNDAASQFEAYVNVTDFVKPT